MRHWAHRRGLCYKTTNCHQQIRHHHGQSPTDQGLSNIPMSLLKNDDDITDGRRIPFWAHSVLLAVLLLGLLPILNTGWSAFPDEGLYTAQADALAHGSWKRERPAAEFDHDGAWTALSDATIVGAAEIPYARRPLYPLLISPFWGLGGFTGLLLISILGTWFAGVFAGLTASILDPRAAAPTLWLVGAGSPLLFDAYLAVGHSMVAGLSALLAWSIAKRVSSGESSQATRLAWTGLALLVVIPLVLIRTEGVIIAGGLALGLVLVSFSRGASRFKVDVGQLVLAALIVLIAGTTYVMNTRWATSITAASATSSADLSVSARRPNTLATLWSSVLRPWFGDNQWASAAMFLVLLAAVLAPLALRFLPRFQLLGIGLLLLGAGAATVRAIQAPDLISGLLPATPWLIIGVASLRRSDLATRISHLLLVAAAVSFVLILTTAYGGGGAAEWGGRFFHAIVPVLAPVAVIGLGRMGSSLPRPERRAAFVAIAITAAAISIVGVRTIRLLHQTTQRIGQAVVEASRRTDSHVVVYAMLQRDGTSRMLWPVEDDRVAILASPGLPGLRWVTDSVPAGANRITFVTDFPDKRFLEYLLSKTDDPSWRIKSITPLGQTGLSAVLITRPAT